MGTPIVVYGLRVGAAFVRECILCVRAAARDGQGCPEVVRTVWDLLRAGV